MRDVVHLCLAASDTLLNMCKSETMLFSFLGSLLCKNGRSLRFSLKQTQGSNDKTIIELGYCAIS